MSLNLRVDRSTIVVGGTLGLALLLVLYWVLHLWLVRQDFIDEIETIQPRTARLLGMVESFDTLEAAVGESQDILRDWAYPAEVDSAMTAAAMQQSIRELMTDTGLSISGSQILPPRDVDGFDRLGLDITAEGNIDALNDALLDLESLRPLVFVDSVKLKPVRSSRYRGRGRNRNREPEAVGEGDPRKLTARFELFSLRLQE